MVVVNVVYRVPHVHSSRWRAGICRVNNDRDRVTRNHARNLYVPGRIRLLVILASARAGVVGVRAATLDRRERDVSDPLWKSYRNRLFRPAPD